MPGSDIALNIAQGEAASATLKASADALNPSVGIPGVACQAQTLREYRARMNVLQGLLEKYQALLRRDDASVRAAMENLVIQDAKLAGKSQ